MSQRSMRVSPNLEAKYGPNVEGADGAAGTPGADGVSGTDGINGTPGSADGAPGFDGTDGNPGPVGPPWPEGSCIVVALHLILTVVLDSTITKNI